MTSTSSVLTPQAILDSLFWYSVTSATLLESLSGTTEPPTAPPTYPCSYTTGPSRYVEASLGVVPTLGPDDVVVSLVVSVYCSVTDAASVTLKANGATLATGPLANGWTTVEFDGPLTQDQLDDLSVLLYSDNGTTYAAALHGVLTVNNPTPAPVTDVATVKNDLDGRFVEVSWTDSNADTDHVRFWTADGATEIFATTDLSVPVAVLPPGDWQISVYSTTGHESVKVPFTTDAAVEPQPVEPTETARQKLEDVVGPLEDGSKIAVYPAPSAVLTVNADGTVS